MNKTTRCEAEKAFRYNGFIPYGAAQVAALACQEEYDFAGNVTEKLIKDGRAEFIITNQDETAKAPIVSAYLKLWTGEKIDFCRE